MSVELVEALELWRVNVFPTLQCSLFDRQFPVLDRESLELLRAVLGDAANVFESLCDVAVALGMKPAADPADAFELVFEKVEPRERLAVGLPV